MFKYDNDEDMLLTSKVVYNSNISTTQKFIKITKGWSCVDQQEYMFNISPTQLEEPELSEQKQIHLYCKWRPLLPVDAKNIICPKPSEDMFKDVRILLKNRKENSRRLYYTTFQ